MSLQTHFPPDAQAFFPPLMSPSQFALSVGVSLRTVDAWILRGHIPSRKVGRRRLVDVFTLCSTGWKK